MDGTSMLVPRVIHEQSAFSPGFVMVRLVRCLIAGQIDGILLHKVYKSTTPIALTPCWLTIAEVLSKRLRPYTTSSASGVEQSLVGEHCGHGLLFKYCLKL